MNSTSAQNFKITEIKKYPSSKPVNKFSTITVDDLGSLFYSTDRGIVEDYGIINRLHEITYDNSGFEPNSAYQLRTSPNHGLFLSTSKGIYYINTETNERKWIWNAEEFTGTKEFFNYTFTHDENGHLWVFYRQRTTKKINLLNVNKNQTFEFKGDTVKIASYFSKIILRNKKMKIRNHPNNITIQINNMLFSLNSKENNFQLCHFNPSNETSILFLTNPNDRISSDTQTGKFKAKNLESLIYYPKKNVDFIEVKGAKLIKIDSKDLRFNGKRVDFLVAIKDEIIFYNIKKSTQGFYLDLVIKFRHKRRIKEIEYFKQQVFLLDDGNKLYKITNKQSGFEKFEFNPNKSVRAIVSNAKGLVYAVSGANGSEVYKIHMDGQKERLPISNKAFKTKSKLYNLHLEGDSLLWVISERLSLVKYNLRSKKKEIINYRKNTDNTPQHISRSYIEINKNELLFYDGENLVVFNKRTKYFKPYRTLVIPNIRINKLLRRDSEIWIGTDGHGLYKYDEIINKLVRYHRQGETLKISGDWVYDLHLMENGNLLIANNKGLDQLDVNKNQLQNFCVQNGLPDNRVVSIIETQNEFWLGTFNGLSKMTKKNNSFYNFFEENGLTENEFNKSSSFKLNDTVIFFGGMNGFIKFNPEDIYIKNKYDYLKPSSIEYFDDSLKEKRIKKYNFDGFQEIFIPFDRNYIKFYIGGAEKGNLLYQLNDNEWVINERGKVSLQGLSAGYHTLKIKSRYNSSNILTYQLLVQEVFYRRKWVQILGFVVLFVISIFFLRRRLHEKEKEYKLILKTRKLEDVALRYQMSPHFIKNAINNIQSTLFLKGEKMASRYISNFATMIRFTLYNAGKDRVSLKEELNYLRAYISMEHLRHDGEFDYEITVEGITDIEKIEFPPLLFQPIVENAIVHGLSPKNEERKLEVKFSKKGNYIFGDIVDNGVGLSSVQDVSSNEQKSLAIKVIHQRMQIYNQKRSGYLSFGITRIKNKTIATIKILIIKPDEF